MKDTKVFVSVSILIASLLIIYNTFNTETSEEMIMSNTSNNQNNHKNYSDSGIQGTINFVGLECPPFNIKQIPPCSGPYSNFTISIYSDDDKKKLIASTQTDSNGNYHIIARPGKYVIYSSSEPLLPPTIDITKAPVFEHITIQNNQTITKNFNVNSQIR